MNNKLTLKQDDFCKEFITTGNATESYRRVYSTTNMKPATINRRAKDLMDNGKIKARIQELDKIKENEKIADAKEIQEFLTKMMRGEINEQVPMCINDEVEIAEKQITPKDRQKSAETLAKMRGYFDIKIKVENVPIIKDDI